MKKLLRWIPACIIIACSWYLSSQPSLNLTVLPFPYADKVIHTVCFAGLSFWIAFANSKSIILSSLYGIVDEIHQSFVPGRTASPFDWMADTVGAILGTLLFITIGKLFKRLR